MYSEIGVKTTRLCLAFRISLSHACEQVHVRHVWGTEKREERDGKHDKSCFFKSKLQCWS